MSSEDRTTASPDPYPVPRSIPAPNVGRLVRPPPPGSRLWRFMDLLSGANIWLYRVSGGRVGGRMGRAPVLLLHHVGRRSGKQRVTPVLFLADGERLVVVGSKGGAARHPAWFVNLLASPLTTVEVARRRLRVRAREASEEERSALWPRLLEIYPSYGVYQARTERVLPVAILEPHGDRQSEDLRRREPVELSVSTPLPASATRVWERVTTPAGINDEMRPWLRMTLPPGVERLDPESVELGRPIGRSWILLFGLVPIDYDDVTLVELEDGRRFLERSPMLSMRLWEHERAVEPDGDGASVLHDRVRFQPRLSLLGPALLPLIRAFFRHRHRRARRWAEG